MNALAQSMLAVAKGYLGPAAQSFLSAELHAIGVNANTVTAEHIGPLAERVRVRAVRLMGDARAAELAEELARCRSGVGANKAHRAAIEAAESFLASGKLRQAEKAYMDLVQRYGDVASYLGLARTQATLEDMPAALTTLREGAVRFARANDRANAVSLLAEAVTLVPADLAAHRRLAAALANQGDVQGAVDEYERFVDVALTVRDPGRALLEIAYARETLGDLPALVALVDRVTVSHSRVDGPRPPTRQPRLTAEPPRVAPVAPQPPIARPPAPSRRAPSVPPREVAPTPTVARSEPAAAAEAARAPAPLAASEPPAASSRLPLVARLHGAAARPTPAPQALDATPTMAEPEPPPVEEALTVGPAVEPVAAAAPIASAAPDPVEEPPLIARTQPDASDTAVVLNGAHTLTHAEQADLDVPVDFLKRAGIVKKPERPRERPQFDVDRQLAELEMSGTGLEAAIVAASRAALLTGAQDARATDAALDAARRLLALRKLQAASDVLLDLIGHGFTDREAQRLLIEVNCSLGRRDVAREKCTLLSQAYRLDGDQQVAEDVERLGRMI